MASEFSLSLSFDGIVLLRRDSDGSWTPLGEVSVEDPELDAKMKRLLRKLRNRSGGDPGVDLILPDSEIRYLDCPLPEASGSAAQRRAVEAALDGATPYALDELRYDWVAEGGRLQVAVIALQTVEEAESFVRAHGFAPRGLTARPAADRFAGVPDFAPKPDREEDAGSQSAVADESGQTGTGDATVPAGPGASDAPGEMAGADDVPAPDHAGDAARPVAAIPDTETAAADTGPGAEEDAPVARDGSAERPDGLAAAAAGSPEATAPPQDAGGDGAEPAEQEPGESSRPASSGDEAPGAPPDLAGTEAQALPADDVAAEHALAEGPTAEDAIAADHGPEAPPRADDAEVPADAPPEPGPARGEAEETEPAPPPESGPETTGTDVPQVAAEPRPEATGAEPPEAPAARTGPRAMPLRPQGGEGAAKPAAAATGLAGQREIVGPLAARARLDGAGEAVPGGPGAPSAPAAAGKPDGTEPGKDARKGRRGKRREAGGDEAPEGMLVAFASRRDAPPPRRSGPGPVLAPPPLAGTSGRGSRQATALAPPSAAPVAEVSAPTAPHDETARAEDLARSLDPRAAAGGAEPDEAERLTLFGARGHDAQIMAPPRRWGRYIAVAAAVLVLIAALVWYVSGPPSERIADPAPPTGAEAISEPDRLSLAQPEERVPQADPMPPAATPDAPSEAPMPTDGAGMTSPPETAAPAADTPVAASPAEPPAPAEPAATEMAETADPAPIAPALSPESFVAPAPDAVLPVEDRAGEIVIPVPDRAMVAPDPVSLPDYADGPREVRLPQPQLALPPGGESAAAAAEQDGIGPEDVRDAAPAAVVRDGRPPLVPPPRPGSATTITEPAVEPDPLAGKRPRGRPEALVEASGTAAPAAADGSAAAIEPRSRPEDVAEVGASETRADPAALASGLAPASTVAPRLRPSGIAAAAAPARPEAPTPAPAAAATPAPQVVSAPATAPSPASTAPAGPIIPSRASVAREATREDVLALNRMNLIGVYGGSGDRRALVRLANGRYVKVEVGDDLDGGEVAAIGENFLTYVRRGESVRLDLAGEG